MAYRVVENVETFYGLPSIGGNSHFVTEENQNGIRVGQPLFKGTVLQCHHFAYMMNKAKVEWEATQTVCMNNKGNV